MLEPEQEYMLAKRWIEEQDADAAHQMVTSHLRLAAKIAMGPLQFLRLISNEM